MLGKMLSASTTRMSSRRLAFSVNERCRKRPDETADDHNNMAARIRSSITDFMDEINTRNKD